MALDWDGSWGCGIGKGNCVVANVEVAGGDWVSEASGSTDDSPSLLKTLGLSGLSVLIAVNDPYLASDVTTVGDLSTWTSTGS